MVHYSMHANDQIPGDATNSIKHFYEFGLYTCSLLPKDHCHPDSSECIIIIIHCVVCIRAWSLMNQMAIIESVDSISKDGRTLPCMHAAVVSTLSLYSANSDKIILLVVFLCYPFRLAICH